MLDQSENLRKISSSATGVTCVSPTALAQLTALGSKPDSCATRPVANAGFSPSAAANFHNRVQRDTMEKDSIDPKDWAKPPDRPGWAFEVRGYTFHDAKTRFVREARAAS